MPKSKNWKQPLKGKGHKLDELKLIGAIIGIGLMISGPIFLGILFAELQIASDKENEKIEINPCVNIQF